LFHELTVSFQHETERALLVTLHGEEVWLPKSQIKYADACAWEHGDEIEVLVPDWLARTKGLLLGTGS
jgi:hypothetical protein